MNEAYLNDLIKKFWDPLSNKFRQVSKSDFFLIMFLVAYSDCINSWDIHFIEEPNHQILNIPIKLPTIEQFSNLQYAIDEDSMTRRIVAHII